MTNDSERGLTTDGSQWVSSHLQIFDIISDMQPVDIYDNLQLLSTSKYHWIVMDAR
jgi:hypothetical protein